MTFRARTEDGKFGDVLLADALTSYARPLSELYIAFSMMWTRPSSPSHVDRSSIIVVPILLAYPFAIRLRQCITDSQPLNALKYATAFPAIALSTLMRAEKPFIGTGTLHQLWLVAAGINALYVAQRRFDYLSELRADLCTLQQLLILLGCSSGLGSHTVLPSSTGIT